MTLRNFLDGSRNCIIRYNAFEPVAPDIGLPSLRLRHRFSHLDEPQFSRIVLPKGLDASMPDLGLRNRLITNLVIFRRNLALASLYTVEVCNGLGFFLLLDVLFSKDTGLPLPLAQPLLTRIPEQLHNIIW